MTHATKSMTFSLDHSLTPPPPPLMSMFDVNIKIQGLEGMGGSGKHMQDFVHQQYYPNQAMLQPNITPFICHLQGVQRCKRR